MILAIDASLSNTAVARGTSSTDYVIATFGSEHKGDNACARITRYRGLVGRIMAWIGDVEPDAIFLEGYSFGSNDAHARFITEYGGMLRNRLLDLSDQIWEIAPTTLKKFASGHGGGKKAGVIARLEVRYGVKFKTNDEYDAFGLFQLGLMVQGLVEPRDLAQSEVLHQLQNPQARKASKREQRLRKAKEKRLF